MALLIKDTPVLTGKDAKRFVKRYLDSSNIVSKEEIQKMKESYNKIRNINMNVDIEEV